MRLAEIASSPEAVELVARYPAITACRLSTEAMPSGETQAHIEVLLPQHQVILNAIDADAAGARAKAIALAAERLAELAKRDPRIKLAA
jgi:hypothetical protein